MTETELIKLLKRRKRKLATKINKEKKKYSRLLYKSVTVRRNSPVPFRVDRIKDLGNAVVPAQVSEAFERLIWA